MREGATGREACASSLKEEGSKPHGSLGRVLQGNGRCRQLAAPVKASVPDAQPAKKKASGEVRSRTWGQEILEDFAGHYSFPSPSPLHPTQ